MTTDLKMLTEKFPDVRVDLEIKTNLTDIILRGATYEEALARAQELATKDSIVADFMAKGSFGFCGVSGSGNSCRASAYRPRTIGVPTFMCPMNDGRFSDELDRLDKIGDDSTCSYCGSMIAEEVLALVERGECEVNPGKPGKFYIRRDLIPNAVFGGIKTYLYHWTPEQIKSLQKLLGAKS